MKSLRYSGLCIVFSLISLINNAQGLNDSKAIFLTFNPVKLFMGLINFEFGYQIKPPFSLKLSSEYLVFDYAIKRENHPDFLVQVGSRYHLSGNKDFGDKNDLFLSIGAGYMLSKKNSANSSIFYSSDIGYRHLFKESFVLNPKIGLTVPLKNTKTLPGLECLIGFSMNDKEIE